MKVFGMVTTRASDKYTPHALASFFAHTSLSSEDHFYLIDNDSSYDATLPNKKIEVIKRKQPASFAANMNEIMSKASSNQADLYFLNNDLIFTPGWLDPLTANEPAIISPYSNREFPYIRNGLRCELAMNLEQFLGKEADLIEIVKFHRNRQQGFRTVLSLPFFCIKVPYTIYSAVGPLDESFGKGGAEDNDYCVRVILAGFRVQYAASSYILHFSGKSTWSGAETKEETDARCQLYQERFKDKWGERLRRLLIDHDNSVLTESEEVIAALKAGSLKQAVELLK